MISEMKLQTENNINGLNKKYDYEKVHLFSLWLYT